MPAIAPSGWPKKEASWSRARETGHNQMSGGWGSGTTTPSEDAKGGEPEIKGAGCTFAQDTLRTTSESTSTVLRGARASHNRADTAVGGDGAKKTAAFSTQSGPVRTIGGGAGLSATDASDGVWKHR